MADDAAAPEGELTEATENPPESSPEETTESPQATDPDRVDGDLDVQEGMLDGVVEEGDAFVAKPKRTVSHVALATAFGLVIVLALGGLVGWLGWQAYQSHEAEQQRALFLQVGKQAAINLTTIDFAHADTDVKRILDSATDQFYDDFSKRSQPFVDVVKQAQSKSTGEVTSAGVESETGDSAQVLVAVTVKTSNAGAPEQQPRAWRMRISVKKVDNDAKVSNVEFVP
jgi:Mce-associated membrane protein